jgi:hypothetical protein
MLTRLFLAALYTLYSKYIFIFRDFYKTKPRFTQQKFPYLYKIAVGSTQSQFSYVYPILPNPDPQSVLWRDCYLVT